MRTSVVTGCAGGIGRAICGALRAGGDRIIGLGQGATPKDWPSSDRFLACDLTDMDALQRLLPELDRDGPVACLVNCAGLYEKRGVFDTTLADFDRAMAVNVRAPFVLSQYLARGMAVRGGGVIVNVASLAATIGSPLISYGTSKAAVVGLTKSLARALAPHGIRVNAVSPGITDTAIARDVDPAQMARQMENVAMKRWAEPAEIARVVAFVASDGASYMTGTDVSVNGGWIT
ncbi:MAG: short-chain dehydrogenase [Martelella sp.]|uniref:SDR family NAD(P)-dependent oxidoreductase n=1 Tax=unclassified Martelella TaxID=2629616 RepID=UPI000C375BF8|nr:SDR family oxidoreductase [Martelella sp.]MAU22344.1 short-chain dehydrogenase [Martelella sp.]